MKEKRDRERERESVCVCVCDKVFIRPTGVAKTTFGQGGNSQNFLEKFVRFFVTFRCFYGVVIHRKEVLYDLYSN